jgi:hypothetical protein
MAERDVEAFDLVRNIGVSLSMAKKLMAGIRTPGPRTARALNGFFKRRIYALRSGRAQTKTPRKTL